MTMPDADDAVLAFPFIGGRPCLDFVATLGKRHSVPVERLPDPAAFGRWIVEAGLQPEEPTISQEALAAARKLREALYRLLTSARNGQSPDPADLTEINQAAARPDLAPQLVHSGAGTAMRAQTGDVASAVLATVSRDAVLLVGGPLVDRVKECENDDCSLLFLDDSQARRRRWCSMERCGNLAKIAGYRSRNRGARRKP
ncbi:CGNR zinc finger domain-containing protein [Nonomuraea sp. NPDC050451]|uniref:CGNR zinc finger domain-containing protein n=1 Tax=Nonomuraea sp. NPDC050451 TaxID=3364364 RepID=UPI0037AB4EBC